MVALTVRSVELDNVVNVAAWDAFVQAHDKGTAFHLTAWGKAIHRTFDHAIHYLAAYRGADLAGILPLIHVKSRLFGNALISNAFAVYGGPLADGQDVHDVLDAAAWGLAEKLGVPVLEYRSQQATRLDWQSKLDTYATFKCSLSSNSDENMKAIPRKQRAEVRKSLGNALTVDIDRKTDKHFAVYAASVHNLGTPVFPKRLFCNLLECYGENANILTVSRNGIPLSSVLSLYFKNEVIPYYGGGLEAAREFRANDHMYWMLMEHAINRGCTSFDFGRSKLGTGAYAFKKNWGFEPTPLAYEFKLAAGQLMPDINPLNPKYRAMVSVWKKLPLRVANLAGPFIAGALG